MIQLKICFSIPHFSLKIYDILQVSFIHFCHTPQPITASSRQKIIFHGSRRPQSVSNIEFETGRKCVNPIRSTLPTIHLYNNTHQPSITVIDDLLHGILQLLLALVIDHGDLIRPHKLTDMSSVFRKKCIELVTIHSHIKISRQIRQAQLVRNCLMIFI